MEASWYCEFRDNPEIEIIELQPRYTIHEKFPYNGKTIRMTRYTPDFKIRYRGEEIVIEIKGYADDKFKLRMKWFLQLYGDTINYIVIGSKKSEYGTYLDKFDEILEWRESQNEIK